MTKWLKWFACNKYVIIYIPIICNKILHKTDHPWYLSRIFFVMTTSVCETATVFIALKTMRIETKGQSTCILINHLSRRPKQKIKHVTMNYALIIFHPVRKLMKRSFSYFFKPFEFWKYSIFKILEVIRNEIFLASLLTE